MVLNLGLIGLAAALDPLPLTASWVALWRQARKIGQKSHSGDVL